MSNVVKNEPPKKECFKFTEDISVLKMPGLIRSKFTHAYMNTHSECKCDLPKMSPANKGRGNILASRWVDVLTVTMTHTQGVTWHTSVYIPPLLNLLLASLCFSCFNLFFMLAEKKLDSKRRAGSVFRHLEHQKAVFIHLETHKGHQKNS